jgi:hypothetical protein
MKLKFKEFQINSDVTISWTISYKHHINTHTALYGHTNAHSKYYGMCMMSYKQ